MEAFRDKPATVGRARIFADKSRTMLDPGMLAMTRIVEAVTGDRLMDYRYLGRSGLKVSNLALGTFTFGRARPLRNAGEPGRGPRRGRSGTSRSSTAST
jgi:hypothetical protein